jgi:hypothetical protein
MKNRLRHVRLWVTVITLLLVPLAAREAFAYRETKLEISAPEQDDLEFGASVAIDGDTLVVGSPKTGGAPNPHGAAYVYEYEGTWDQVAVLTPSPALEGQSGSSVAISGVWVVVGARFENSERGAAYVFRHQTLGWFQSDRLLAPDAEIGDRFGRSVSIDGSRLVVGASHDDDEAGSAHVFRFNKDAGAWLHEAKLTASDAAAGDRFGLSVSIDGTDILVGAPLEGSDGAVYVFTRTGGIWTEVAKLTPSCPPPSGCGLFGQSVSLDGDRAAIGAPAPFATSVLVFEFDGGAWEQIAQLRPAYFVPWVISFGESVALQGDTIIAGDTTCQAASVFTHDGTSWVPKPALIPSSCEGRFGNALAINGTRAVVGAVGEFVGAVKQGTAHVFELEPLVDVRVNGENWPVVVGPGQSVRFSFSLDPGAWLGDPSDYWIFIVAAGGMVPWTVQAPLVPIPDTTIMNAPLAPGWYIFFFAVDDIPDGAYQQMWYDFGVAVCEP